MSDTQVAKYDPNFKEQQKATKAPPNADQCVTADKLGGMLNVGKFNKMMDKVSNTATSFLTSYIKSQNAVAESPNLDLARYRQTALNEKRIMTEKHEAMINGLNQLYGLYDTQIINAKNTEDLYKMLVKQNNKLEKNVESEIYTIDISDRKTYYENEQNSSAGWWSSVINSTYKYLIILLIVAVVLRRRTKEMKLWGTIAALALYPIVAFFTIDVIVWIYNWIMNSIRWVYLYGL